jgi:hypothetical protein
MTSQDGLEAIAAPFYRAIGRAMSRWQHVEAGMFLLAHAILGTEFKYTSTTFFLINSADLKLRLVNGLCQLYFDEHRFKTNWQPIAKDIKSAIKFRNGIAHFEPNFVTDRSYLDPDEPPIVLSPHHLDLARRKSSDAASTNRMNQAAEEFLHIANALIDLIASEIPPERINMTDLPAGLASTLVARQHRAKATKPRTGQK